MTSRIINHHGNVEEVSAPLPIIERLTRTPANSNRIMPVNPDGPKAARIIAELYEALETAAKRFRDYEQIHRLKGTEEGYLKADNNGDLAIYCEAALAKARGEHD